MARHGRWALLAVAIVTLVASACGNDTNTTAQYCDLSERLGIAANAVTGDLDPATTPAGDLRHAYATFVTENERDLDRLVDLAPDAIRDDVASRVDAVEATAETGDPAALQAAADADQRVLEFEVRRCGASRPTTTTVAEEPTETAAAPELPPVERTPDLVRFCSLANELGAATTAEIISAQPARLSDDEVRLLFAQFLANHRAQLDQLRLVTPSEVAAVVDEAVASLELAAATGDLSDYQRTASDYTLSSFTDRNC